MINCLLHYFIMFKLLFFKLTGKFRVGHFYGAIDTRTYANNIYYLFNIGFVFLLYYIISDFGNSDIVCTYYILKICGRAEHRHNFDT